jgi:hypothetical protein
VSGDTLFYAGSTYRGLPVWYSTDPKSGRFKRKIESVLLSQVAAVFVQLRLKVAGILRPHAQQMFLKE